MTSKVALRVTVNGSKYEREVPSRQLLADFLREDLGLTGTQLGCEQGVCGSCTVMLDGDSVRSCLLLAAQVDGAEIVTVEGLAQEDGALHPIQRAFWEHHGLQCGFCTPGMMITALDLIAKLPLAEGSPELDQKIREGIAGNLCRCTGYQNIVAAVRAAAAKMSGQAEAEAGSTDSRESAP